MAPRARQAKNKARIQKYEELASEKQFEKIAQNEIVIPPPPRLGNDVVIADKLQARRTATSSCSTACQFSLPRGGIVGIIGPNGAGKTTLFRMIVGSETPDAGTLKVGETVQLAYVDQSRTLDGEQHGVGGDLRRPGDRSWSGRRRSTAARTCRASTSGAPTSRRRSATLSGGERNRLHLAKTLMAGGNLLLLDEPTNDLDVDTLRALEEALLDFAGCAVVISHDRWFLDRIATHILAFEGNTEVVWYEGNYQAYIEDLKRRKGPDADQPHRHRLQEARARLMFAV